LTGAVFGTGRCLGNAQNHRRRLPDAPNIRDVPPVGVRRKATKDRRDVSRLDRGDSFGCRRATVAGGHVVTLT
jgi:hypothetical protein